MALSESPTDSIKPQNSAASQSTVTSATTASAIVAASMSTVTSAATSSCNTSDAGKTALALIYWWVYYV